MCLYAKRLYHQAHSCALSLWAHVRQHILLCFITHSFMSLWPATTEVIQEIEALLVWWRVRTKLCVNTINNNFIITLCLFHSPPNVIKEMDKKSYWWWVRPKVMWNYYVLLHTTWVISLSCYPGTSQERIKALAWWLSARQDKEVTLRVHKDLCGFSPSGHLQTQRYKRNNDEDVLRKGKPAQSELLRVITHVVSANAAIFSVT